jgi:hypothetical protein
MPGARHNGAGKERHVIDQTGLVEYVDPPELKPSRAFSNVVVTSGPLRTIYVGAQTEWHLDRGHRRDAIAGLMEDSCVGPKDEKAIVERFWQLMEAREWLLARALLAPGLSPSGHSRMSGSQGPTRSWR